MTRQGWASILKLYEVMLADTCDCEWHGYFMGLDADLMLISGMVTRESLQISSSKYAMSIN